MRHCSLKDSRINFLEIKGIGIGMEQYSVVDHSGISRWHQKYIIVYLLNSHFFSVILKWSFDLKKKTNQPTCCKCWVSWNSPILLHIWLAALNANSSFKYETSVHYYLGIFHVLILGMRILWVLASIVVCYSYTKAVSNERIVLKYTVYGFVIKVGNAQRMKKCNMHCIWF